MQDTWVGDEDGDIEPRYPISDWSGYRSMTDMSIPTTTNCNESYNSKFKAAVAGQKNKCNVWRVIYTMKVSY
jgi:hypothetical protein